MVDIDSVEKFRVLNKEYTGFVVGDYKIFSMDVAGIGFFVHPVGSSDPKSIVHMFKYKLREFINQNFIEVLA